MLADFRCKRPLWRESLELKPWMLVVSPRFQLLIVPVLCNNQWYTAYLMESRLSRNALKHSRKVNWQCSNTLLKRQSTNPPYPCNLINLPITFTLLQWHSQFFNLLQTLSHIPAMYQHIQQFTTKPTNSLSWFRSFFSCPLHNQLQPHWTIESFLEQPSQ